MTSSLPASSGHFCMGPCDPAALRVPAWITRQTGLADPSFKKGAAEGIVAEFATTGKASLVSVKVADAIALHSEEFRAASVEAYRKLFDQLKELPACAAVRFWNFLPGIHQPMSGKRDRYMVFNAGRFAAFESRYGGRDAFDAHVATASAVGHGGSELVIHCLALNEPGRHLGNPRQISPHRYSEKYGPVPPCFARGTVATVNELKVLLAGGTASIRGEASLHNGDLAGQTAETFQNLATLVESASAANATPASTPGEDLSALSAFTELRVYHPRADDRNWLADQVRSRFVNVKRPEFICAELCRSELLVEIEGVAVLARTAAA